MKGIHRLALLFSAIVFLQLTGCEPEQKKDYSFIYKEYEGIHAAITMLDSTGNEYLYPAFRFSLIINEDHATFTLDDQKLPPSSYSITDDNNDFILIETGSLHHEKNKCYKMKYDKNNGTIILAGLMGGPEFELYPTEDN